MAYEHNQQSRSASSAAIGEPLTRWERQIFQKLPGFVAVLNGPDHVFQYVNDAYVKLAGPRNYLGRTVRDVLPEIAGQGFYELLDSVYTTGEPYSTHAMPIKLQGELNDRFVDFVYQPLFDDNAHVIGIFVSGNDVTNHINAEARLHELNVDLERKVTERALARGRTWQVSPEIMGVLNEQGYFEASNPAWQAVLGWSESEIASTVFFDFIHPDDLARTQDAWTGAIERGEPALRFENRYKTKAGDWRWLSWVAVPDDRKVYCSARDVTVEKTQSEALTSAEEALRQSQKMEAVGQLTGGVAHDFNNLLTVIKSSSDLLKRANLSDERRTRYIDAISSTVDRAATLTGQLLAFARRQALKPRDFDVAESVRMISDMIGTLSGSRIQISAQFDDEPCFINADSSQFDTALVNLALNARDAMKNEGHLTIRVKPVNQLPPIRLHDAIDAPFVAIELTDTGSGISEEILGRIFEPFFTTKEVGHGTGLGLSQVFGFVKQSGGDVLVRSELAIGTTFTLFLPRVAASASVAASEPEPVSQDGRGACVLVVEDNAAVGEFVTQTLGELGYRTNWVRDASAALAELAANPGAHEIVFSDVVMPGMTGIELGEEIRQSYPGIPVVLTSGYSHVLVEEGGHGFELLQKPYSVKALSHILQRAIRRTAHS